MSKEKDEAKGKGKLKIIITILLPVFAIVVPIALYMFQLKDMNLTYEVVSYSLINLSSPIQDEIEVSFSGEKVTDLSALNIEIKNAGNTPIRKEDFERAISIDFGKDAKVLKSLIKYKFPANLAPVVKTQEHIIQISPLLLNSGDYFSLEAIISNSSSDPNFDARIAGIKTATKINTKQYLGAFLSNVSIVMIICILLLSYSFLFPIVLSINPFTQNQKLLNFKPIGLVSILSGLGLVSILSGCCSGYLIGRYRFINFTSTSAILEILLYLSVMALGMLTSFLATKELRTKQNDVNESGENANAQQSA